MTFMTDAAFLRSDLDALTAYVSHPGGTVTVPVDRLDTNESPYDLPLEMKQILADLYVRSMETNRYPDGGHDRLKALIADYVNESAGHDHYHSSHISVGNGSDELIRSILIATCVNGAGSILVAQPTFSMYGILAQTLGIPVFTVDRQESDFGCDIATAQLLIQNQTKPPIRVVFMVHPNSPTGQVLNSEEMAWLRSLPENILVVIDEAYFEFSKTSLTTELLEHPNWVIMRTFSKAFRLAALRVGYAIAHPKVIEAFEKIRLPYNLPSFSQAAAILAMEKRDILLDSISEIRQERELLANHLAEMAQLEIWPSDANFIYARLRVSADQQGAKLAHLAASLKSQGTLIRHTGGGLRITVGMPAENARTVERLQQYFS